MGMQLQSCAACSPVSCLLGALSLAVVLVCCTCSFISRESSPLLWASTYQAGEHVGDSSKLQEVS
jgi:hypothetical protein